MAMHANKCLPQEKNAFMTRNSTIRSFSSIKVRYIVKINQEGRAASNIWQYKNDSVIILIIFYMQINAYSLLTNYFNNFIILQIASVIQYIVVRNPQKRVSYSKCYTYSNRQSTIGDVFSLL